MFANTKKTVASVMSAFSKTIADLEQVEIEHRREADRQEQIAHEARAAQIAAANEAASARTISNKLLTLVSTELSVQGELVAEAQ